jgi:TPR repeat protein
MSSAWISELRLLRSRYAALEVPYRRCLQDDGRGQRGCPHSQGVLALCVFRSEESYAANKHTARQLANASAEVGSKYGQFALGRILECETPDSERSVAAPHNAQGYALAAAQGLDEAQVDWGMAIEFETVESGGVHNEARRLFLLAAAQGSHTACEQLFDLPLDDGEVNYWRERIDSARNASLYSAGLPRRSATLTNSVSVQAALEAVSQQLLSTAERLNASHAVIADASHAVVADSSHAVVAASL